jgi:hypothetical protein
MRFEIGNVKIEASGGSVFIKAFGREVFVKREAGQPLRPHVRRDAETGSREIWAVGMYAVLATALAVH